MKKLFRAAEQNDVTTVRTLLDAQTDSKKHQRLANAALASAAWFGSTETVALLLDRGAQIDRRDGNSETALIMAAHQRRWETARFLIERGTKFDQISRYGETALTLACGFARSDIVQLLLEKGADPNVRTPPGIQIERKGLTAIHAAVCSHLDEGPAMRKDRLRIVEYLLQAGADINAFCSRTPLMEAALRCDRETVVLLLNHGADLNTIDDKGHDVFHWAERNRDPEVLAFLKEVRDFRKSVPGR